MSNGLLQRKCACGDAPSVAGECEQCHNKNKLLSGRQRAGSPLAPAIESRHEREARRSDQAINTISSEDRAGSLGFDFGRIRVEAEKRFGDRHALDTIAASHPMIAGRFKQLIEDEANGSKPGIEMGKNKGVLGHAPCDINTGKVKRVVTKEHCFGNCVFQHEDQHALDYGHCCEWYKRCVDKAPDVGGRMVCHDAWNDYMSRLGSWTECNAYNREGQCLTQILNDHCRGGGGSVSNECCASLEKELDVVTKRIDKYCPEADVPRPCAFTAEGAIQKF